MFQEIGGKVMMMEVVPSWIIEKKKKKKVPSRSLCLGQKTGGGSLESGRHHFLYERQPRDT